VFAPICQRRAFRIVQAVVLLGLLLWSLTWVRFTITYWLWYGAHALNQTDFGLYYVFSLTGQEAGWAQLYSLGAQAHAYQHLSGLHLWWFPLPYSPPVAWIFFPFTLMPLQTAYWVWAAISCLALLIAWWVSTPTAPLVRALCLTLALSPYLTQLALVLGQWVVVEVLAVALSAWALRHGRERLAGLALAPAVLAPQAFILVPFVLLLARRWRTLVTWAGAGAVLALVSVLAIGIHGAEQYTQRLLLAQRSPMQFAVDTSIVVAQLIGHHHAAQKILAELAVVLVTGLAAWRQRGGSTDVLLPIGLVGSMLSASFLHLDDLMLLIPAAWLTLRIRQDALTVAPPLVLFILALQMSYGSSPVWSALFVATEGCWLLILGLRRPAESRGECVQVQEGPGAQTGTPREGSPSVESSS
jgi:hypothetical protein